MKNAPKTQPLTKELSAEEIQAYSDTADDLARKYSVSKVFPVVLINPDSLERVVCYLKEPAYIIKLRIMDKAATLGVFSAADELREAVTLKEESDPLTYGEDSESDAYKMGVVDFCLTMVSRLQNQFKKK